MYRVLNPIIYFCLLILADSRYYQPPEMSIICKIDKERSEDCVEDCGREKCAGEISNFTIHAVRLEKVSRVQKLHARMHLGSRILHYFT